MSVIDITHKVKLSGKHYYGPFFTQTSLKHTDSMGSEEKGQINTVTKYPISYNVN